MRRATSIRQTQGTLSPETGASLANDIAVIVAVLANQETVHLRLELRPFGMNIYDDVNGLHIGGNAFRGNEIRNAATAINLG